MSKISGNRTPQSHDMPVFHACLSKSKHIIAIAGAGLSAASGIPTFRGAGGMWRKHDAMSLATPQGFEDNPSLVWQFYHYRREVALKAQPNAAHKALAQFSLRSIRQNIAPDSTFTLITQNVDGLSARALADLNSDEPPSPNDPRMLEMHGKLFDVKCTACTHVEYNLSSPICPGFAGTEQLVEASAMDPDIPHDALPRCTACHALARPGVVWFGEEPVHLKNIDKLVRRADLCIVVGTSSTVYPAAGYANKVQRRGGEVAVFNLEHSEGDDVADFLFLGPCEETLPKALGLTISDD